MSTNFPHVAAARARQEQIAALTLLDFVIGLLGMPHLRASGWALVDFMFPARSPRPVPLRTAADLRARVSFAPHLKRAFAYEFVRRLFTSWSHRRRAWDDAVEYAQDDARRPRFPFLYEHDADTWAAIAVGLATCAEGDDPADVAMCAAVRVFEDIGPGPLRGALVPTLHRLAFSGHAGLERACAVAFVTLGDPATEAQFCDAAHAGKNGAQ